jgi:hypothetical protein
MINSEHRKFVSILILIAFIVLIIVFFIFIDPVELVERIGVQNGYILAFVVSFFGGFSAGGSVSFISLLITLVAGGLNPFYLGLVSGVSLAIGDIIMFYAGSRGRELVKGRLDENINKAAKEFEERKWLRYMTPAIVYLYMGFSPFPNDILILFLAAIKYPLKKIALVMILGDITFTLLLTMLATTGVVAFG